MKKFFIFLLILVIGLIVVGTFGYQQLEKFLHQPIHTSSDNLLTIERGTTGAKLAQQLEQKKLLENAQLLPWLLRLKPDLNKIKAGTYSLDNLRTVQELLNLLNSGKEAQFSLQFIEGTTAKNWRKIIENAPYLQQTLKGKSDQEIAQLLEIPIENNQTVVSLLEGWLYPDTYHYTPNSTDLELLKRASKRMQQALDKAWRQRAANLPLKTPLEMLTLASIVEKETGLNHERAQVASVFINRLNKKMKLQTDPTVIYGMGESYQGNIRKKDLETFTTYNTYIIDGLPPSPIAMPSEESLKAVSQPAKTDYFYFVAKNANEHQFSKTLSEHNKAVQEYLRWYRSQK
ncbi:endolytic transglycosylase MltG [Rodentibacter caecimuris]|uniref:Endolytic murein transglycosylase n=1 Tax=Rodentibacter caecimuris TaxID=1796644 RepID=A0ABX3KWU6_9PAST|nr:cell division protein YceG [Rodentibacter heylii]